MCKCSVNNAKGQLAKSLRLGSSNENKGKKCLPFYHKTCCGHVLNSYVRFYSTSKVT